MGIGFGNWQHFHTSTLSIAIFKAIDLERERDRARVDVGDDVVVGDVLLRDGLRPHGLPDAAHARVEAGVCLEGLFAAAVDVRLGRVPHEHGERVFALLRVGREVDGERELSALVRGAAHLVVAEEHDRAEVDRAEVQENLLARLRVEVDLARVP